MTNVLTAGKRLGGHIGVAILVIAALLLLSAESRADSGPYLGVGVGSAGIDINVSDTVQTFSFDENGTAWKVFGGFNFDVVTLNLAVEGGYVDLGAPSGNLAGSAIEVSADGIDLFGVAGVDLGPVGVFAKLGMIAWDAEGSIDQLSFKDDGNDTAYGVGANIGLGSVAIRAEYEVFKLDNSDDVSMVSASLVWTF